MKLFPAIDMKDCKVVRLYKGDFATVHQVADDPLCIRGAVMAGILIIQQKSYTQKARQRFRSWG